MKKLLISLFLFLYLLPVTAYAQSTGSAAFVNVVNPIRGTDFWEMQNQKPEDVVNGQIEILKQKNVTATWLIRYDALKNEAILNALKNANALDEKGIFLEVTPTLTNDAGVNYRESQSWHFAESVLLTGYEVEERKKLIDTSFEKYKGLYGSYPKSVGAWWIDAGSIQYMQEKYGIVSVLVCADQYSTDNYQIWGQYWSTPYYPDKQNALYPPQEVSEKIPVVMMQWASRDPVNAYGKAVEESTYSVQANDYIDYHNLDINYFSKLVDIYTTQKQNQFGEIVIGLENTYDWQKYKDEYTKQIETVVQKRLSGQLQINTMSQFSNWYRSKFPELSPQHSIIANDPLGSDRKVVWFMNPYYRAGWFYNNQGSVFRDVRQYVSGEKEPCLEVSCKAVNFATFKTRSLDEVTFQDKWTIDQGRISNLKSEIINGNVIVSYTNGAQRNRLIEFLPRDIKVDDQVSSIDTFILRAKEQQLKGGEKIQFADEVKGEYFFNWFSLLGQLLLFLIFIKVAIIIPGFLLTKKLPTITAKSEQLFLTITVGIAAFTLTAFFVGIIKSYWLLYLYALFFLGWFIYKKELTNFSALGKIKTNKYLILFLILILAGTFFQSLAVARSGWVYEFGYGFWGPTGHDHIWHQALNNQLLNGIPPENPIFSGITLTNYHYFFNILIAATTSISFVDSLHLLYRFYPILFSLLLGIGFFVLSQKLFRNIFISAITLYFVYFGSSFGWIVEYMRSKTFGGESNFWINQPVSFNLNPPFAISMILFLAVLILFANQIKQLTKWGIILFVLLAGTLIEYKVYAGLIIIAGLLMISLQQLIILKQINAFKLLIPTTLFSALLFIPQNKNSSDLIIYSPFWFIHAMAESPDRLGITKLSEARMAYQQRGEYLKFILTELLSLLLFIVGNLGTRFIALLLIPGVLLKKVQQNLTLSFIIWMILISFSVPLLFIQKGTPWNTIQFSYYGLYLITLFVGLTFYLLYNWSKKLGKTAHILISVILGAILVVTPISSYATFESGFGKIPPARLPFGEIEALSFLQKQQNGVVLTYPFDKQMRQRLEPPYPLFAYETSSYVSAFAHKPTYLEDEIQMDIFQIDYKDRLVSSNDFFRGRDREWSTNFLKQNAIKYIYLPKVYGFALDEESLSINNIFENSQVLIYSVN